MGRRSRSSVAAMSYSDQRWRIGRKRSSQQGLGQIPTGCLRQRRICTLANLDKLSDEIDSEVEMEPEPIRHLLDANGIKFTTQRYCVLQFLMENAGHPTAAEIFDGVNRLDPRSSKATIYRNLRDLVEAGLVREVAVEGRSARFDLKGLRHHHFICDRCGEVENMEWFDIPQPPPDSVGTRIVREYEMILRGLCASCAVGPHHSEDSRGTDASSGGTEE